MYDSKVFPYYFQHLMNLKIKSLRIRKISANCYLNRFYNGISWKVKEREHLKKAEVGNVIEFREGLQGIVEKVNENSVIVDLTYMDNYRDLELDQRTVINHKNYTVVKESAF
jgi:uncharacterized protein YkvS